jgi:hypothetical protein
MLVLVSIIDYDYEQEQESFFEAAILLPANLSRLRPHSMLRHVERISHAFPAWHFRWSPRNNYLDISR